MCACTQSCLTVHNAMDCSLSSFSVHGIFQARILEWVAISYSKGFPSNPGIEPTSLVSLALAGGFFTTVPPGKTLNLDMLSPQSLSRVQLFVAPWTCQAPLPMEFSRQEYYNGVPFPTSGYLLHPGSELTSFVSPASAGRLFTTSTT